MLYGRPTVFLSCSEKYKSRVALPMRDLLKQHGIYSVIVSEEPLPYGVSWEPDNKVQRFLEGSDALIALCTPDDLLDDGTYQCRPNIIDEIQRARQMPHLRSKVLILKAREVKLPSNINPTYTALAPDAVVDAMQSILVQLKEWGVLDKSVAQPVEITPNNKDVPDLELLVKGLKLGDHSQAQRRAYHFMLESSKIEQQKMVDALLNYIMDCEGDNDNTKVLNGASLLEAFERLDPQLIRYDMIERMSLASSFSIRSSAAILLQQKASRSPGEVPIDLVGRLARPADEDWYVSHPAMTTTKILALSRIEAYEILEVLANSEKAHDRDAVVNVLDEIVQHAVKRVPKSLVKRLTMDQDELIAGKANNILSMITTSDF